jgi:hypothetical protein
MNLLSAVFSGAADALGALAPAAPAAPGAASTSGRSGQSAEAPDFAALLASALAPEGDAAEAAPQRSETERDDEPNAEPVVDVMARIRDSGFGIQGGAMPAEARTLPLLPGAEKGRTDGIGNEVRDGSAPRNPIARDLEALFGSPVEPASGEATAEEAPAGAAPSKGARAAERPSARTRGVVRALGATDPEFRARFERVIDRMEREFGHRVEVVETYRTQERQNQLFEQGRTVAGPVVTWTRNSNHTQGRAADLLIDGRWDNPQGYARLAQVAREEGLRTLGARDPGHVELPGNSSFGGEGELEPLPTELAPMPDARAARAVRPDSMARVAEVARVADVAPVAEVARVASVAPVAAPGAVAQAATPARGAERRRESLREQSEGEARAEVEAGSAHTHAAPAARGGGGAGAVSAPAPVVHADAAARVARVMELQQSGAPRELSHVLLKVDAPDGTQDRIRLDLRGSALDATIDVASLSEAGRLSSRVGELQRALAKQGVDAEAVRIRATSAPELTELARAVAASGEVELARSAGQPRSGAEQNPGRERGAGPFQRESGSDSPGSRNRSRKEQQGGKDS